FQVPAWLALNLSVESVVGHYLFRVVTEGVHTQRHPIIKDPESPTNDSSLIAQWRPCYSHAWGKTKRSSDSLVFEPHSRVHRNIGSNHPMVLRKKTLLDISLSVWRTARKVDP